MTTNAKGTKGSEEAKTHFDPATASGPELISSPPVRTFPALEPEEPDASPGAPRRDTPSSQRTTERPGMERPGTDPLGTDPLRTEGPGTEVPGTDRVTERLVPIPEKLLRAAEEAEAAAEAAAIRDDADEAARQASRAMAYHAAAHSRHGTASASATPPLGAAARPKAVMGPNLGQATGSRGPTTAPTTGSPHPNTPPPSPVARRRAAREEIPLAGHLFGLLEPDTPQEAEEQFKRYIRYFKENGYDLAAKLAEHFMTGNGRPMFLPYRDILKYEQIVNSIQEVEKYSEQSFVGKIRDKLKKRVGNNLVHNEIVFEDDWTSLINSYAPIPSDFSSNGLDLYFGLGSTNLKSRTILKYRKNYDDVNVQGIAVYTLSDVYDFASGIGSGVARVLVKNGMSHPFPVYAEFEKNFSGNGKFSKSKVNMSWSVPRAVSPIF